jgi:methyl-accepting chemotaxis protein
MGIKAKLSGFKVRTWLIAGFGLMAAILVVIVAVSLRQVQANGAMTREMVGERLPSTLTGAAASEVRAAADSLGDRSQALRGEVESFLGAVRVA